MVRNKLSLLSLVVVAAGAAASRTILAQRAADHQPRRLTVPARGFDVPCRLHPKTSTRFGAQLIREDVLTDQLDRMADEFRQLRRTVDALVRSPAGATVPIIAHGYDYAHPSGTGTSLLGGLVTIGPWILPGLLERNIVAPDEQVEIVNTLVDRFNELLQRLQDDSADGIAAFHHAELRGVLDRQDWSDELHPGAAGRDKLAARLRQQIVSIVVS